MAEHVGQTSARCHFCGYKNIDYLKYGVMYKLGRVKAHYFCVLLSNRLIQNGNDQEGILGFLLPDILRELKRTSNVSCAYCKKKKATIQCSFRNCKRCFHLPCGLKKNTSHQFCKQFKSFCHVHSCFQNIPEEILNEAIKNGAICCICHDEVVVKNKKKTIWAPCCMKTWYHRFCLQQLAYSAGYFFRCAACNDVQKFNKHMQQHGIFIPQQDASWERVPNAFSELLFRYSTCDAEECKCPFGRQKNAADTDWEVIVCCTCGSQGVHVVCGNLKYSTVDWECSSCEKITKSMESSRVLNDSTKEGPGSSKLEKLSDGGNEKKRRNSDDLENLVLDKRKKSKIIVEEEDDEEAEVDVETVEEQDAEPKKGAVGKSVNDVKSVEVKSSSNPDIQEILTLLKPGPLSYKLSVIQKICKDSLLPLKKPEEIPKPPLIDLIEEDIEVIEDKRQNEKERLSEVSAFTPKKAVNMGNFMDHLDLIQNLPLCTPMVFILSPGINPNISNRGNQLKESETVANDEVRDRPAIESEREITILDSKFCFREGDNKTKIFCNETRNLHPSGCKILPIDSESKDVIKKKAKKKVCITPDSDSEDEVIVCERESQVKDVSCDDDVILICS